MERPPVPAWLGLGLLLVLGAASRAPAHELKLGTAKGSMGETVKVRLTMTATSDVQGLVFVAEWDGAKLSGANLVPEAVLASADVVVRRIEPAYVVLGVVMDSNGEGGEIIPSGSDIPIASLGLRILINPPAEGTETVPLTFMDLKYGTTDGGPALENLIVVRGRSIARTEGLVLTDGEVKVSASGPTFRIASREVDRPDRCPRLVDVPVTLKSGTTIQGYVTAVRHRAPSAAPALKLKEVLVGPSAGTPDFFESEVDEGTGGTLGVVIDLDEPFGTPPPLPPGSHEIAIYRYCIDSELLCGASPFVYSLEFVDSVLGDPPKENLVVAAGLSVGPALEDGTLTLRPPSCQAGKFGFAAGGCVLADALDGSGNPIPDPLDPAKVLQVPARIVSHPGEAVDVGLWYRFPPDLVLDPDIRPELVHQIQGLSMAVCYDRGFLHCLDGKFSLEGTMTQAVGAEFVNVHCQDQDPVDSVRKGELVVGILVDALPPFERQYLPPTDDWLQVICVKFQALTPPGLCDAPEEACSEITFCDGANGQGNIRVRNLISVDNLSFKPMDLLPGTVCLLPAPVFIRGDCNFNFLDQGLTITAERLVRTDINWRRAVDISDGAALISFLFQKGSARFQPPCLDACDTNDDGRIDLADAMLLLRYIFRLSSEELRVLFDKPRTDDEEGARTPNDRLDCKFGSVCTGNPP